MEEEEHEDDQLLGQGSSREQSDRHQDQSGANRHLRRHAGRRRQNQPSGA